MQSRLLPAPGALIHHPTIDPAPHSRITAIAAAAGRQLQLRAIGESKRLQPRECVLICPHHDRSCVCVCVCVSVLVRVRVIVCDSACDTQCAQS